VSEEEGKVIWTGHIKRGELPGTIVGFIQDEWGWTVTLAGAVDKEGGGYSLQGRLGKAPDSLRVDAIDDPTTGTG
jgi:hypothetical protein